MHALIGWIISKIGFETFTRGLLLTLSLTFWSFFVSFVFFMLSAFVSVYNLTTKILEYINSFLDPSSADLSSEASEVMRIFVCLLNSMGILPAINDNKAIIVSAMIFYISAMLSAFSLYVYRIFYDIISRNLIK